ncbi:acyl-CoA dehydrogenase family protein [Amycolatopsis sp. NPDC088138]|uniref:acyl-CoA dehydrogenase family protein n=1 Tax=Amycolatopsis sp. NPDC088138 TaxID=3363938 RepID=UPI0038119EE5
MIDSPAVLLTRTTTAPAAVSRRRADEQISWLRDYSERRINSLLIDERRCIPPYIALDFGRAGLLGPLIEERHGGTALRFTDAARVFEQLAAIDTGLATWVVTSVYPGTRALSVWATEGFKAEWLPLLAGGRVLGAYAQTEPGAGSDFGRITTTARLAPGGGWRLTGEKHWIGNGSWAGVLTVLARVAGEQGEPTGITAFAVPAACPGVHAGEEHLSSGQRGMVQNRMRFQDVAVPAGQLLGGGRGVLVASDSMGVSRFALATAALGAMKRLLQLGFRFADGRRVAGGPLVERAAALAVLGRTAACVETAEALVYGLAERFDAGLPVSMESVVAAKVLTSEWAVRAADDLVQLLGGRGYDEANTAARQYRDLRVYRIFEGTTEVLLNFLGNRAVHQPGHVDTLLRELAGAEIAERLRTAVAERRIESAVDREWHRALAGKALAWAFAAGALHRQKGSDPGAVRLAEDELDQALTRVRKADSGALATPGQLAAAVTRHYRRISEVELTMPGARTRPDLSPTIHTGGS